MTKDTSQQLQGEKSPKKDLLPEHQKLFKGIDFKRYRVVSPSELISEPIKDKEKATSTSLDRAKNNMTERFSSIMER